MSLIEKRGEFFKVAGKLIYGWALVCEQKNASGNWEPYIDTQGDHIPEDVMVDAALDFAKNSRIGKDMHAGDCVAGVPFVYVVTKSSNSLGLETNKTGMLIGWEPDDPKHVDAVSRGERTGFSIGGFVHESDNVIGKLAKSATETDSKAPRVFRRFEISEISLVDLPAMVGATIGYVKNADGTIRRVIAERLVATSKRSALTTATNGHSHLLSAIDEMQAGTTSYASSSGSEYSSHSHPWIRHDDGTVTIGEADGHTHALVGATEKREAIASKSTTATPAPTVSSTTPPEQPMTTDADKITALEKRNSAIAKMVTLALTLPETHRAHAATLAADEVETFLSKSFTEREAIAKATIDADPEVYKTTAGISIRKSQGPLMEQLARQNDSNAVELEKARTAGVVALLKARAKTDIGHLVGDEVTKVAALRAVDTISDETERNAVTAMLKGADAAMAELSKAKGVNPGEDPLAAVAGDKNAAFSALEKGLTTFAKTNNITKNVWTDGLAQYTATPEGAALNKAYRDAPSAQ